MIAIILDYQSGDTIIKTVPKNLEELEGDEIIDSLGYKSSNVCYMINNNTADIVFATDSFSGVLTIK